MPTLKADAMLSSSNDERFPPEAAFSGNGKKFFVTTGMYPQEVLVGFPEYPNGVNVDRILFIATGIAKINVSKCTEHVPGHFEPLVATELSPPARENDLQREQFQVNKAASGSKIRFIKITIEAGYAAFATLRSVIFEGEPTTA